MSRSNFSSRIPYVILLALVFCGATLLVAAASKKDSSTITIEVVAEDLVFRGNNPTLYAEPGSRVKLVFRNESSGIEHNFVIEGIGVETDILRPGEREEIIFTLPPRDTVLTYVCSLHPKMMRGIFVVGSPNIIGAP